MALSPGVMNMIGGNPAAMAMAGRMMGNRQPAAPQQQKPGGFLGQDAMTWLAISGALAQGAQGGGWGAAVPGILGAFDMQKQRGEEEARSDAQRRALEAMQMGDMNGATSILASARGLEGDAMNLAIDKSNRDHAEKREQYWWEKEGKRADDTYARGRKDALADLDTQRGWDLADQDAAYKRQKGLIDHEYGKRGEIARIEADAKGGPDFGDENSLRNQYLGQAKTFQDVARAARGVRALSQEMNPAEQMALIFSTMKMLDPGSTVREGEYATAQNTTGALGQLWNMYNKAKDGKFLDQTQIANFRAMVDDQYGAAEEAYVQTLEHYQALADRYSMPAGMIQDFRLPPRDAGRGAPPPQARIRSSR